MTEFIDKLALFYIQNRKVLAVRSFGKSLFYMPGGKREGNETDTQALIREIEEELSVQLDSDSIHYATTLEAQADGKPAGTIVRLTCYFAEFSAAPMAAAEIEELKYLDSSDLPICSKAAELAIEWLKSAQLID